MKVKIPFERYVPKDLKENLEWRKRIFQRVLEDPSYANVIRNACATDPIFYCNGFVYTFDPRLAGNNQSGKLPFILYPFQRDGLLEIFDAIGNHDLLIEKTRDMGASWLNLFAFEYLWHFKKLMSFLIVSRDAFCVDASDNPKSLFWKLDFIHENLPTWLMPVGFVKKEHRLKFHLKNPETKSVIDGEATTSDIGRGDRRTAILLDEFAAVEQGYKVLSSTRDVTRSRIFNSTPQGINNAYYKIRETNIKRLRFFWTEHPEKIKGLYRADDKGNLEILDKKGYPEGYEPVLDGKWDPRSPWLDIQDERAATDQEIFQEVMIDYLGSGHQYFIQDLVQESIRKNARNYLLIGDLEYDSLTSEPVGFREREKGRLKLWVALDREGVLSREHKYVLGCDVSAGTGNSNSTGCGYDITTYEKVLEYANPYILPEEFAKQMVAIARWLHNAYLVWESNGPGLQFSSRVQECRYGNIYFRKMEEAISKKQTLKPGWHSAKETKGLLIGSYREAVQGSKIINTSKIALEECLEYVYNIQGLPEHSRENNKEDPSGAKHNHGDRVIADALALRGMTERTYTPEQSKPEIPMGSLAWRKAKNKKPRESNLQLLRSEGW